MSLSDRVSIPSTLADQSPPTRLPGAEEKQQRRLRDAHVEVATCATCGGLATREEVLVHRPGQPSERRVMIRCLSNVAKGRTQGQSSPQEQQAAARCPVQNLSAADAPPVHVPQPELVATRPRVRAERSPDRFSLPQLTCPICGKVFQPRRSAQRLCSAACNDRERYLREKAERNARLGSLPASRNCDACGSTFAPTRRNHRFCSQRCLQASYYRRKTASPAPVNSTTTITCQDCAVEVQTHQPGKMKRCPPCQRAWRTAYQRARRLEVRGEAPPEKEAPVEEIRCQDCGAEMKGVSKMRKRCDPCKHARKNANCLARYHRLKHASPRLKPLRLMAPPSPALLEVLASPPPAPPHLRPPAVVAHTTAGPGYDVASTHPMDVEVQ